MLSSAMHNFDASKKKYNESGFESKSGFALLENWTDIQQAISDISISIILQYEKE